jgi:heat shock protein HtpX
LIGGAVAARASAREDETLYTMSSAPAEALLQRLCMRADVPIPELVVEYDVRANAWTAGGRIHVTDTLIELLDKRELEAVLAHELAHLARRDAAAMEICSAPSRVLLGFSGLVAPWLARWTAELIKQGVPPGIVIGSWVFAVLSVPPAFVIGSISRLSVLSMSRAREFAADAAAATLTGSPSALASALLKLDGEMPRRDLRQVEMLCIVGRRSRYGRWLSTHPPTATRVKRLEALEIKIQEA